MRLVLFACLLCSLPGSAQESSEKKHEFTIWQGVSFANGHVFGFAQERHLTLTGVRYGRRVFAAGPVTLRFTAEFIPVANLTEPYAGEVPTLSSSAKRRAVLGAGFNPVGLQLELRTGTRWQPFFESNGGFLYFERRILSSEASRFNFTIALGGGAKFYLNERFALLAGYRYHHLSNANITNRNPGVDTQQVFGGISFGF